MIQEMGDGLFGPVGTVLADKVGVFLNDSDGSHNIHGEALTGVIVDEAVGRGIEMVNEAFEVGSKNWQVFVTPGEAVMGAKSACDEEAVETIGSLVVVVSPVELYPMGMVFIEEESGGGFDGFFSRLFWGGGSERLVGFPLALESFGGAKVKVGSVEGPLGGFDLVDVKGSGDFGFNPGVNIVRELF